MSRPLDIVVPVLNEAAVVDAFCDRVEALGLGAALLFVDNGSTDGTLERLERRGVRLIRHATNLGYGASIRDGIAGSDAERIVIIDADLEYPPESIPQLLEALEHSPAVYGSRFLDRGAPAMPWLRRIGNRCVTGLYNLLFRQRATDLYTGMKALRRGAFSLASLERTGFEHVVELAVLIAHSGSRIRDVPIAYAPRERGASKMRHLPETLKFLYLVLRYWPSFAWAAVALRLRGHGARAGRP